MANSLFAAMAAVAAAEFIVYRDTSRAAVCAEYATLCTPEEVPE